MSQSSDACTSSAPLHVPSLLLARGAPVVLRGAINHWPSMRWCHTVSPSHTPPTSGHGTAMPAEPVVGTAMPTEPVVGTAMPAEPGVGTAMPAKPGVGTAGAPAEPFIRDRRTLEHLFGDITLPFRLGRRRDGMSHTLPFSLLSPFSFTLDLCWLDVFFF